MKTHKQPSAVVEEIISDDEEEGARGWVGWGERGAEGGVRTQVCGWEGRKGWVEVGK